MVKISKIIATQILSKATRAGQTTKMATLPLTNGTRELPGVLGANLSHIQKYAMITSHKDMGGTIVFGYYPDNYIKLISREFVEEIPERIRTFAGKTKILPSIPAHYEETYELLPHYHIDKLWTTGKGSGTRSVQDVVRKSLEDINTQGRVTLDANCIDGKTAPGGFYYKLGFRFKDPAINEECAKWLAEGGKKENAPFAIGTMFLPKENITHCLNYGCK